MATTNSSPIPASPVPNVLPATRTNQPVAGGTTFIETANYADGLEETENLGAFIVALKSAVANSATYAALQAAVAALPNA